MGQMMNDTIFNDLYTIQLVIMNSLLVATPIFCSREYKAAVASFFACELSTYGARASDLLRRPPAPDGAKERLRLLTG